MSKQEHRFLVALGSNVRHARYGRPPQVLAAALRKLAEEKGVRVDATAPIIASAPIGPSLRRYANTAALVSTTQAPEDLLALFKRIERAFGRRAGGQRWGSRVLDLDIVLWNGGAWNTRQLTIPHPAFRERGFVLTPAAMIAPRWRDPLTGLTIKQLEARLTRRKRLPR